MIPVVHFVAASSGTGKTTLLERVIALLTARGVRVGAAKRSSHMVELDTEGKDSWRLRKAGARVTALLSPGQETLITTVEGEPSLKRLARKLEGQVDILIVEGGKSSSFPRVEVRRGLGPHLPEGGGGTGPLEAIVTDRLSEVPQGLPALSLDDPEAVCRFLKERFLGGL